MPLASFLFSTKRVKNKMKTVEYLLGHIDELLMKKPFLRGGESSTPDGGEEGVGYVPTNCKLRATTPRTRKAVVSQERFQKEFDPMTHDVIFDENIPSICVKIAEGTYQDIKFVSLGLPLQRRITEQQTLYLCGNKTTFTMRGATPSQTDKDNFDMIKEYWEDRNMDGWRTKAIFTQKSQGDVGLLFYHNRKGEIKCRLLCYEDGYTIISHNDDNGERLLECVYYRDENNEECIDCYDDTYAYQLRQGENGWEITKARHGFSENPLVTKRGDVAWNAVQSMIEVFETIYNVFMVIQKRHGWGILYIRGAFKDTAKKLAGSVVLNDKSMDGSGKAEFLTPPSPQGMLETMQSLWEQIQIGSSTTFLLPKDVKSSGDISALAIMLTQSLDIEGAEQGIIEWQNFISKMQRLFVEGLAIELVNKGINETAITDFKKLRISAKLKVWRPFNEAEYNQMLATLKGAGLISTKTGIEKNTVSAPDELARVEKELEEARKQEEEKLKLQQQQQQQNATTGGNGNE